MIEIPQMEPWFDEAEADAVSAYMKSGGWVMEFKKTAEFERVLAEFLGVHHVVLTTNGTISLTLALLALGLKAGDEVLVPDTTMIATPNAGMLVDVRPMFVDVDPKTLCMNLQDAERRITPKTKAMMYVALNGRSGDMNAIKDFCRAHKLFLIEDAAQALGCHFEGKFLGTFGEFGSFSLSAPKVITTGQGGFLATDDDALAARVRALKDFGRTRGGVDIHDEWGWNFKFTDIQAVIGLEQMKKLPWRLERKKQIFTRYRDGLSDIHGVEFLHTNLHETSPWFVDIYVDDPDALSVFLREEGIGSRRVYPAIHTQRIYQDIARGDFPVSTQVASRGLWLPSSSKLVDAEIDRVVEAVRTYYTKGTI